MTTYIVLLRGINVGGHNKLPMVDLRTMLSDMGFKNVQTYIQSGNVILESNKPSEDISKEISVQISKTFGYTIPVLSITKKEFIWCYNNNPFLNSEIDIKTLHVTFLNQAPSNRNLENLIDMPKYKNDNYKTIKSFIYLHTPDGYAKTKFSNERFEKLLDLKATTRNWKTTTKLFEMLN